MGASAAVDNHEAGKTSCGDASGAVVCTCCCCCSIGADTTDVAPAAGG